MAGALLLPLFVYAIFTLTGTSAKIQLSASEDGIKTRGIPTDIDLEKFQALPYTQWSSKTADANVRGVTIHDRARAFPGINLYANDTREVYLVDISGKQIHTWLFPPRRNIEHAYLMRNGDVIGISVLKSILRVDWKSNVIWQKDLPAHHDITLLKNGTFLIPIADPYRDFHSYKVMFDSIARLSESGQVLEQWSTFDHLSDLNKHHPPSPLDRSIDSEVAKPWEQKTRLNYFHMNAVSLLPSSDLGKRDSRFREGNWLVCMRNVNLVVILNKQGRVVWSWGPGILDGPHHPTMLDNGHILVFDNGCNRQYSRVLEIDPVTLQLVWQYQTQPPQDFYSSGQGSSQRLPNGNTLICQSDAGRAFEVDATGKILWEFWNPSIVKGKRHKMYRFIRYPVDYLKM